MRKLGLLFLLLLPNIPLEALANSGSIPAEFSVTPTGSANYAIPIRVPSGIEGLHPNLALSYDSRQGFGIAGYGWSLQGLPVIKRCNASLAVSGHRKGIRFNEEDKLCFNGQQLISVPVTAQNATYEFRTQFENWSRIVGYGRLSNGGGPTQIDVWTKDNRKLSFGSNLYNNNYHITPDIVSGQSNPVLAWALKEEQDLYGNKITYAYETDSNTHRPSIIAYRYVNGSPTRSVSFEYEKHTKTYEAKYIFGKKISPEYKIKNINVFLNGTASGTKDKQYSFEYASSEIDDAHIVSISECFPECDNPVTESRTDLEWEPGKSSRYITKFGFPVTSTSTDAARDWNVFIDIDGNGIVDLIRGTKNSTRVTISLWDKALTSSQTITLDDAVAPGQTKSLREFTEFVDINNDGVVEFVVFNPETHQVKTKYLDQTTFNNFENTTTRFQVITAIFLHSKQIDLLPHKQFIG